MIMSVESPYKTWKTICVPLCLPCQLHNGNTRLHNHIFSQTACQKQTGQTTKLTLQITIPQ